MKEKRDIQNDLFLRGELNQLGYNSWQKIGFIAFIFLIILLSTQISYHSYQKLAKTLDDPYSNLLKIEIPSGQELKYFDIAGELKASYRDSFDIDTVDFFRLDRKSAFLNIDNHQFYEGKRRTIEPGSELLLKILSEENNPVVLDSTWLTRYDYKDVCGAVVSRSFLKKLGYKNEDEGKELLFRSNQFIWDIKIKAIVDILPDKAELLLSNSFDQQLDNDIQNSLGQTASFQLVDPTDDQSWKSIIQNTFGERIAASFESEQFFDANQSYKKYRYNLYPAVSVDTIQEIIKELQSDHRIYPYPPEDWMCQSDVPSKYYDYVGIYLNDLNQARPLAEYLALQYAPLDITNVIAKENFGIVAKLTTFLSLVVFILGLLLLVVYLYSMLAKYFNGNIKQLGMLKAFGFGNKKLKQQYIKIIARLIGKAIILALIADIIILIILFDLVEMKELLLHWISLLPILLILGFAIFTSLFVINKIVKSEPGDLVYGRSKI